MFPSHDPTPRPSGHKNIPKSSTEIVERKEIEDWDKGKKSTKEVKASEERAEKAPQESKDLEEKLHTVNGVHLDLYDYFSLPIQNQDLETLRKLQFVNTWVTSKGTHFGEGIRKLHAVDLKLGCADSGETKLVKLYNWLRFSGRSR